MKTVFETKQEAQAWYENNCMKCNDVDTCSYHSDVVNSLVTLFLKDATIDEIGVISEGDDYAVLVEECEISDIPKSLIEHNVGITARSEPDCHPAEAISIYGSDLLTQLTRAGFNNSEVIAGFKYSGKGNGTDIYIDTDIAVNTIDTFSITFKVPVRSSQTIYGSLFGAINIVTDRYVLYMGTASGFWCNVYLGYTQFDFSSYVAEGDVITLTITKNTSTNYTVTVVRAGSTIFTQTSNTNAMNSITLYIYDRHYSSSQFSAAQVYSFTINSETWYMQEGSGSKITGSLGTELTVNGTLTNFWQSYNQGKMSENKLILSPVSAPTESDTLVRIFFDKSDNKLKVRYNGTTYILAVET